MADTFEPKLSTLPDAQRRLWTELGEVPPAFVLCGGTAIAVQLGHRASVDFDFGSSSFDPDLLYSELRFLAGSRQVQKSASTLTCVVERDGPVLVSFFGAPAIRFVHPPLVASDNGLRVATLLDLAGMKAAVVQKRPEAKDYLDLDAIITLGGIGLATALSEAGAIYGASFNPELTLKALCFFGDGNLNTLPADVRSRLVAAVASVDLNNLPPARPGQ